MKRVTCELADFYRVGSKICSSIKFGDHIVYLKVSTFLSRKNSLMGEVRNQKYTLSFFKSKAGRLSEYSKDYFYLSFLIEPKNVSIFSNTVNFLLDDNWTAEFIRISCDNFAFFK